MTSIKEAIEGFQNVKGKTSKFDNLSNKNFSNFEANSLQTKTVDRSTNLEKLKKILKGEDTEGLENKNLANEVLAENADSMDYNVENDNDLNQVKDNKNNSSDILNNHKEDYINEPYDYPPIVERPRAPIETYKTYSYIDILCGNVDIEELSKF